MIGASTSQQLITVGENIAGYLKIAEAYEDFRLKARDCLSQGLDPREVVWKSRDDQQTDLFSSQDSQTSFLQSGQQGFDLLGPAMHSLTEAALKQRQVISSPRVPKEFASLALELAHHNSQDKWALIYRLLWRINTENRQLLQVVTDDDVRDAFLRQRAIHREIHKIHAFVRFHKVRDDDGTERFVAWMKTDHPCLELAAPFFMRRFGDKPWSILTPFTSAHWDLETLRFNEGVSEAPQREEELDDLWKSYYRSIFNPARVKLKAMKAEMPTRYWGALPEAQVIQDLIRESPDRLRQMAKQQNNRAEPPRTRDLQALHEAAKACHACPLHADATQVVFGEGPRNARLMIVGEQPGETEDLGGRPFIGPAGEVLMRNMRAIGLDRSKIYLTNSVKHFKWKPGPPGKPRLHQKPSGAEMHACRPWLEREIDAVKPDVIICLGQTAATMLLGRFAKITDLQGQVFRDLPWARHVLVTYHPSAILRAPSPDEAKRMEECLMDTLLAGARILAQDPK